MYYISVKNRKHYRVEKKNQNSEIAEFSILNTLINTITKCYECSKGLNATYDTSLLGLLTIQHLRNLPNLMIHRKHFRK